MEPIRLALVGTGGRGQVYVDVLRRLPPGRAVWTAMCDVNPAVIEGFCAANGLGALPQLGRVEDVAGRTDVDAVLVCTPDALHREPAVTCFDGGKHCLVEKPLATCPDDARAICQAARRSGKRLHLGFVLRYDPCVVKLRELLTGGAIGRPLAVIVYEAVGWFHGSTYMRRWNRFRRFSGDLLLHKGCHTLDIINFIAGAYPARVAAFGGTEVFRPRPGAADRCSRCRLTQDCPYYTDQGPEYRDRFYRTAGPQVLPEDFCVYNTEKDSTDTAAVIAEFDSGMRLSYTMSLVAPKGERHFTFIGTKGEIRCDLSTYRLEYWPLPDKPAELIAVPRPEGVGHQPHDLALLTHFLDRLDRDDTPDGGILDAYMSGAVAYAALESMATGEVVNITAP